MVVKTMKRVLLRVADWVMNLFLSGVAVVVLWLVAQLFFYAAFTIPTDSMMPTLIAGDKIMVDKTVMGARLFDIMGAARGDSVTVHRVPALGHLDRDDIIVFNFPYVGPWDNIAMDPVTYYVKRCVALPGDTVEIRGCLYYINGRRAVTINNSSATRLALFIDSNCDNPDGIASRVVMQAFPNDSTVPWTVSDFGPMLVPGKGTTVRLNRQSATIYRNYIEWETGLKVTASGDSVFIGDRFTDSYVFVENYYFVAGDNVFSSRDSRYFGLLPEPFIVGKATRILTSRDRVSGRQRRERYFKAL
ncbi:MAG: signal peptidase I [Clostridiales bacterium]|nr:signal peptidase I [Clostridiales bacterium]